MKHPLCFVLGHDKRYVGIRDQEKGDPERLERFKEKCIHGFLYYDHCDTCQSTAQIANWVCSRGGCDGMGRTIILRTKGLFRVDYGYLVPDEKRWANDGS